MTLVTILADELNWDVGFCNTVSNRLSAACNAFQIVNISVGSLLPSTGINAGLNHMNVPVPGLPRPLRGIVPPMVTPLKSPEELDRDGLVRLVEHILAGGVSALFVLGTTGEAPSLEYRLRYELVEKTCECVAGRVPVLVGITDTAAAEAVELARFAQHNGAAAVVAAPPYYFPIQQNDLSSHFLRLADQSPLPVFLYNMPACVKVSISQETAERCTSHANIVGIKDSGGDFSVFESYLRLGSLRADWTFLVGPEHLTTSAVLAGGHGGVNGGANLCPRLFVNAYEAARDQQLERVAELQRRIEALGQLYAIGRDFMAVARGLKAALRILGICNDTMSPPFHSYSGEELTLVRMLLEKLIDTSELVAAVSASR